MRMCLSVCERLLDACHQPNWEAPVAHQAMAGGFEDRKTPPYVTTSNLSKYLEKMSNWYLSAHARVYEKVTFKTHAR